MLYIRLNRLFTQNAEASGNGPAAPKALEFANITYELVVNAPVEQQDELMIRFDKRVTGLKETKNEVKSESKLAAILLAGAEVRVKRGIDAKIYSSTFTASDLYKQVTGNKPPGHVYTLKCFFVNYVLGGKITEADYMANRNNCLELAQKIADAVIELNTPEGLQHDAVTRAAAELKDRHENEAKILRGILASVKPAKLMTAEEALEAFTEICSSGNLPVCLAQMVDEIAAMAEQAQQESYIACARSIQKLDAKLGDKVEKWIAEANSVGNVDFGRKPKTAEELAAEAAAATQPAAPQSDAPASDAPDQAPQNEMAMSE